MTMNSPGNKANSNRFQPLSEGSTPLATGEGGTDGKDIVANGQGTSYLPATTKPMTVDNNTGEDVDEEGKTISWEGVQINGKMQPMDKKVEEAKQNLSRAKAEFQKAKKAAANNSATTAKILPRTDHTKPKTILKQTPQATREKIPGISTGGGGSANAPPGQPTPNATTTTADAMDTEPAIPPPPESTTSVMNWFEENEKDSEDDDDQSQKTSASTGGHGLKPAARPTKDQQVTEANDKPLFDISIMAELTVPDPKDKSDKNPVAFPYIAHAHRLLEVLFQQEPHTRLRSVDGSKEIRTVDEMPTDQDLFDEFFGTKAIHNRQGGGRVCLRFSLITTRALGTIKKPGSMLRNYLEVTKTFLRAHKHKSHHLKRGAFVVGKDALLTDPALFEMELTGVFQQCVVDKDLRDEEGNPLEVPTIDVMANTRVLHTKTLQDGSIMKTECQALNIRCEKHRVAVLRRLILESKPPVSIFGIIVTYESKYDNEELFVNLIREQEATQKEMKPVICRGIRMEVLDAMIEVDGEKKSVRHALLEATTTISNNSGVETTAHPVLGFERTSDTGKWNMITTKRMRNAANTAFDEIVRGKGCQTEEYIKLGSTDDYGMRRDNDESNPFSIRSKNSKEDYSLEAQSYLASQMAMRADDMPVSPPRSRGGTQGFKLVASKKEFPHLVANAQATQGTTNQQRTTGGWGPNQGATAGGYGSNQGANDGGYGPNHGTRDQEGASNTNRDTTNDGQEDDDEVATVNVWTNRVVSTPPRASRSPTDFSTATSIADTVSTLLTKITEDNKNQWAEMRRENERRDEQLMKLFMAQQQAQQQQHNNLMALFMAQSGMQQAMAQQQMPATVTQQELVPTASQRGTNGQLPTAQGTTATTGSQAPGQANAPTDPNTLQQQLQYTASTVQESNAMQMGEAHKRKEQADISYPALFTGQQPTGLRQRRLVESLDQSNNGTAEDKSAGNDAEELEKMSMLDLSTVCSVEDLPPSQDSISGAATGKQPAKARNAGLTNRQQKSSLQEADQRQGAEGPRKDE